MRVLITGAAGQLGRELVDAFAGQDVVAADRSRLDVVDRDAVLAGCLEVRPDVVVHAAAFTDVDGCQAAPDTAFAVNAVGTRHVAQGARMAGAAVIYISTDYVFAGDRREPYHEWDDTAPASAYGRSKLAGEHELSPGDTIVRTSWVCGRHGRNFVKTMLRLASAGNPVSVVDDQRGAPTFADDLAVMIRRLVMERRTGRFHVTNQGSTTWFDFAREIFAAAGHDPSRVQPVSTAQLDPPRLAPRPAQSVLDNAALRLSGIELLRDYHDPLEQLVKELSG